MKCVRGITLTELVVVMAVMSILASVAMPMLRVSVKRSKEMQLRQDLRIMRDAIDNYKRMTDEGHIQKEAGTSGYPKTLEDLTKLIQIQNPGVVVAGQTPYPKQIRLLRKVPEDPFTRKDEWGLRSNEDEPDSEIWGGQDVFDVFSLSDGTALDGTKYRDW